MRTFNLRQSPSGSGDMRQHRQPPRPVLAAPKARKAIRRSPRADEECNQVAVRLPSGPIATQAQLRCPAADKPACGVRKRSFHIVLTAPGSRQTRDALPECLYVDRCSSTAIGRPMSILAIAVAVCKLRPAECLPDTYGRTPCPCHRIGHAAGSSSCRRPDTSRSLARV